KKKYSNNLRLLPKNAIFIKKILQLTVSEYIKQLLSMEEYSFSLDEVIMQTQKTPVAVRSELSRLVVKREIVSLRQGFYLIIPPRYMGMQKLPIQLYCEKLFGKLNRKYYLAFYTAAKFHGAGHQQVQCDYIVTEIPKMLDISKNSIEIRFFTTSNWTERNIQLKKSDAGMFKVSSPALTAVDLIHYQTKLGGMNRMLATIEELAEEIMEDDLTELLNWYPNQSTIQRLGYLFDELKLSSKMANLIFEHLNRTFFFPVLLCPKPKKKPGMVNNRWKVSVNINLESDI
ncbi:MAG: type IV toxin-antitoxin system AbiEi family antitoxin, partial [Salinivirgaceae bacterium]|nr:type IV toxin-antitoxin system AbiEi family antitoxin [Salinivirgaceae bacterium]